MNIKYYGHSCFTVSEAGYTVAFDPFDGVPGYEKLAIKADEVLCSHGHFDHDYVNAVEIVRGEKSPFTVTEIHSYHDDTMGSQRGTNVIRILECDGLRIAHFGDIGCRPTDEQVELLKGLDAAIVPVGGTYTLDARQQKVLMDELQPRVIIPMHYRLGGRGFGVLDELSAFTDLYEDVSFAESSELTLTKDTPAGVYALKSAC